MLGPLIFGNSQNPLCSLSAHTNCKDKISIYIYMYIYVYVQFYLCWCLHIRYVYVKVAIHIYIYIYIIRTPLLHRMLKPHGTGRDGAAPASPRRVSGDGSRTPGTSGATWSRPWNPGFGQGSFKGNGMHPPKGILGFL